MTILSCLRLRTPLATSLARSLWPCFGWLRFHGQMHSYQHRPCPAEQMGADSSPIGNPIFAWFHDSVSALVYSLAQPHAVPESLQAPYNDLTRFVLEQHARMPDYLSAPMVAATLAFDLCGLAQARGKFHSRPLLIRASQIAAWKRSRLSICRDLIRCHESLVTLTLYCRLAAADPTPSPH